MAQAAKTTRYRVGLLTAEFGFPEVFEDLIGCLQPLLCQWNLDLEVQRVRLGPFALDQAAPFELFIDRLSHGHPYAREWLKVQAIQGRYVLNHPFQFQTHSKAVGFAAMRRLGLKVPKTWALPPKDQSELRPGVAEAAHELFSLEALGEQVGYPHFLKPHDGGGWVGVSRPKDLAALTAEYDLSGNRIMLAQAEASQATSRFVRCMAVGPRVAAMPYDPGMPHHARYILEPGYLSAQEEKDLVSLTRTICAFHGFEWNTVEYWLTDGEYRPIDFYNAVPDCSLVSLHGYALWTVTALVEWIVFCAQAQRRPRLSTRMARWFELATEACDPAQNAAYQALAEEYYQIREFQQFHQQRGHTIWERAEDYRQSEAFGRRLRESVERTFSAPEVDAFEAHFQKLLSRPLRPPGEWYGTDAKMFERKESLP